MADISDADAKCFTMTWKIKNFSYTWRDLISEPFISRCFDNTKFFLKVENKGSQDNKEIRIYIVSKTRSIPPVDYEMALVTSDGSAVECLKVEAFDFKATKGGIFGGWITETLVVSTKTILERRDAFLPHDTLTIRCRLQQPEVKCSTSEESFVYSSIDDKLTSRCRLQESEVKCSTSEESFVYSSIGVRRKSFVWTLNLSSSNCKEMCVNLLTVWGAFGRLTLKASIKEECEEIIVVEVQRDKGEKIFSTLKLSLLDAHGTEKELTNDSFFFEDGEQVWQSPPSISKSELVASKSQLSPNNAFALKCEFATSLGLINETETITCPGEFISSPNDFHETRFSSRKEDGKLRTGSLQSDLKCILDAESLSDFKLKVGSDVFPVHKVLLGARSPIFNAMFTNDYKENSSGQVLISDIDVDTMRGFLLYLYTDTIDNLTVENAIKLYFAADKYGVLCLKEICTSYLKANLSSSSVCAVLILADLHHDEELKSVTQDFISRHDSEILRSERFGEN